MTTTKTEATSKKRATPDTRHIAYQCLLLFERNAFKASIEKRQKADQELDNVLNQSAFSTQDKSFITALVYGILRHWFQLNVLMTYGLKHFPLLENLPSESQQKQTLKNLDFKVRLLLRMGFFQLFWLNSVPDYAMISSTLNLADQLKLPANLKKQCHAILAKAVTPEIYQALTYQLKGTENQASAVPIWPPSFQESLKAQFSNAAIDAMMANSTQPPEGFWIRINTLNTDCKTYQQKLHEIGITFQNDTALPDCLWIENWTGKPNDLAGFAKGECYIQDISSTRIAPLLSPESEEIILDMCAAPGSKTTHLAALMKNQGKIIALEPSKKRAQQLKENCIKLGVTNVVIIVSDALTWESPNNQLFDRILVDAPCSGTGTLHHQPDSLVQWRQSHSEQYQTLQSSLLQKAAILLKPGGVLLYSTCSLDPRENQFIINDFLKTRAKWQIISTVVSPITNRQDGFFACLMQKPEAR